MYVHVHEKEKRIGVSGQVHHGMKIQVKIFNLKVKLHTKLSMPTLYTYIYTTLSTFANQRNRTKSFIHSFTNFDQVSMPYISKCHFPAYLMQVKCEISGHVSRASRVFLSDFFL